MIIYYYLFLDPRVVGLPDLPSPRWDLETPPEAGLCPFWLIVFFSAQSAELF